VRRAGFQSAGVPPPLIVSSSAWLSRGRFHRLLAVERYVCLGKLFRSRRRPLRVLSMSSWWGTFERHRESGDHLSTFAMTNSIKARTRTPFRLGSAGGGSDLSAYCEKFGGAVLNTTIDRFAYAFISPRDDLPIGAFAGKISDADGGGFLMFIVPPEDHLELINRLNRAGGEAGPVRLTDRGCAIWQVRR
jgi:hypothetical protein